jgi:hypothetical protein
MQVQFKSIPVQHSQPSGIRYRRRGLDTVSAMLPAGAQSRNIPIGASAIFTGARDELQGFKRARGGAEC